MVDARAGLIEIEVVYALPQAQTVVILQVPVGTRIKEAIAMSGIAAQHPGIDWNSAVMGIFGKRASLSTMLRANDRVEIYRPLLADPKQARRKRARRVAKAVR
jgi:putative ubiquitin-RnfH superfamily antitoxin RatB of RatAB toxin-antitoxin module